MDDRNAVTEDRPMQASTINMAQALLDRGRQLWDQNRYDEAVRVLSSLLSLRSISPDIAERAQFYLGDIQLAQGHYSKARRHLAAAIGSGVGGGETHFLMACALEWDDESDAQAAYQHYRKAVELEPGQPLYSSAYALMRIRRRSNAGKVDREALRRLRAAFAAAPDDQDIVYNYAFGLTEMGRDGEAKLVLRRARKRWPDHPAFEGLWWKIMSDEESAKRPPEAPKQPVRLRVVGDDEPVILKFPTAEAPPPAAPSIGPRPTLTRALESLDERFVRKIAANLALTESGDPAELRQGISRSLRDRQSLERVVAGLSPASRHLIRMLSDAGGSAPIKELRLRVDPPSRKQGPHWSRRQTSTPLDELRERGLVFVTAQGSNGNTPRRAVVPTELRRLMRDLLTEQ
jgi:tetratricopeptide (TPR) repeat protein